MTKIDPDKVQNLDETTRLWNRLQETEETLNAIRQYMVDAFVVQRADGPQVVTLANAEIPYRLIVESMNEGVVTILPEGTILYCNPCFGRMVMAREEEVIGLQFRDFILPEDRSAFELILKLASEQADRGEFCLLTTDGTCVPVMLSIYPLSSEQVHCFAIIATDITLRVQAEEKIRALASELAVVEQEERHRISQVLHDDLQQRLYAVRARLFAIREHGENPVPPAELNQTLDQVQDWLTEAITTTRSLSINISPIVLQGDGLAESLQWLCSQMKEQYNLQTSMFAAEDLSGLEEHVRVVLFQTVREVLFNVVKHAATLQATLHLTQQDDKGRIVISDAGKGFEAEKTLQDLRAAHGLLIVKERLRLFGGAMDIHSTPGNGTRVTIEFPLPNSGE